MRGQRGLSGDFHLYRLLNVDGEVIYVGITSDIHQRMKWHRWHGAFWDEVASLEFVHLNCRQEQALLFERLETRRLRPKYNRMNQPQTLSPRHRLILEGLTLVDHQPTTATAIDKAIGRHKFSAASIERLLDLGLVRLDRVEQVNFGRYKKRCWYSLTDEGRQAVSA